MVSGSALFLLTVLAGALACLRPLPAPKGTRPVPWWVLLLRGLLAGIAVACAVALSAASGVAAGLLSTFPAIFLTTMVSLWASQHSSVSAGAVGPMMLGSSSVSAYAVLYCLLALGPSAAAGGDSAPVFGTLAAVPVAWLGAALGCSAPAFIFIRWRTARSQQQAAATATAGELLDAALGDSDGGGAGGHGGAVDSDEPLPYPADNDASAGPAAGQRAAPPSGAAPRGSSQLLRAPAAAAGRRPGSLGRSPAASGVPSALSASARGDDHDFNPFLSSSVLSHTTPP